MKFLIHLGFVSIFLCLLSHSSAKHVNPFSNHHHGSSLVPQDTSFGLEEQSSKILLSRRKRFLCNKVTGDHLCFVPPFSLRCHCGVSGCWMGKCMCHQC
uniref:Uncharacterized protein n=1 Tax=Ditylenchus dipsaci TaxID=166011 RepID=A0A915D6P7_9BILA